jgi:hypothetical protein
MLGAWEFQEEGKEKIFSLRERTGQLRLVCPASSEVLRPSISRILRLESDLSNDVPVFAFMVFIGSETSNPPLHSWFAGLRLREASRESGSIMDPESGYAGSNSHFSFVGT